MLELDADALVDRLMAGGVAEWNAYRQAELADEDLQLTFSNFRSVKLPKDLTGIDLSRAILDSGVLPANAKLAGANLRWSAFPGLGLVEIDFSGADLRNTDFAATQIHKCSFVNADLRDANFSFALLARAVPEIDPITDKIVDRLRCADLSGAQIEGLNVVGCNIQTALGYLPEAVANPEEFLALAGEAKIKMDGATGNVRANLDWKGLFKTYRPR